MKKNIVFMILIFQSTLMLSSLEIHRRNLTTWTVKTAHAQVNVQSCMIGTKIESISGNLYGHKTANCGAIYGHGVPMTMKPVKLNDKVTAAICLANMQRYHVLLFDQDDPKKFEYVFLNSLRLQEEEPDVIKTIKKLIPHDPDLKD